MVSENLVYIRKMRGFSQEELAEKVGISRQTLSKYETGGSIPDVTVCARIASVLDVTVDDIVNFDQTALPLAPKGKYLFGTVTVGEKGEIVLPVRARHVFNIRTGDALILLGDEAQGIGIVKEEDFLALSAELKRKSNN